MIKVTRKKEIEKILLELYQEKINGNTVDKYYIYKKLVDNEKQISKSGKKYQATFSNEEYHNEVLRESEPVTLYLYINKKMALDLVKLITKKLRQENIKYEMILRNRDNSSELNITLIDFKETIKASSIINTYSLITNNTIKQNPFMVSIDNINICQNETIGFNKELAKILSDYIEIKVKNNNTPTLEDLIEYINKESLLTKENEYYSEELEIARSELKRFILLSLNTDNLNILEENYNNSFRVISKKNDDGNSLDNSMPFKEIEKNLHEHILVTEKKHGKNHLLMAIKDYLATGYSNGFSRIMIDGKLSRETFKYRITVTRLLQDMYKLNVRKNLYIKDQEDYIKLNTLAEATINTYNKYKNETNCRVIITEFIKKGNYLVFTSKSKAGLDIRKEIEKVGYEEYLNILGRRYKTDNKDIIIEAFIEEFKLEKQIKKAR